MDKLYFWIVKHRNSIVRVLVAINLILAAIWLYAYIVIVLELGDPRWFYVNATLFGKIAIILYVLTTIPGIFRRFGKFYKPVSILMIFRRYIGIMMFMLVLIHGSIEWLFFVLKGTGRFFPELLFMWFGLIAFLLLFSLFVTSNDWSVSKLGIWWHRIHNLTYSIVGLIFLHVAMQRISIWSFFIGLDAVALVASFFAAKRRR